MRRLEEKASLSSSNIHYQTSHATNKMLYQEKLKQLKLDKTRENLLT